MTTPLPNIPVEASNSNQKHLAFLVDCPEPGKVMLFPDYYEDIQSLIDPDYEEIDHATLFEIRWQSSLADSQYKVFKRKVSCTTSSTSSENIQS